MPEIPEIGIGAVQVPEIPAWRAMPPQSIPVAPPITLQIGFPIADIPGCVETRNSAAGDKEIYDTDPKGNITVCGGQMPSYKPLDYTPGTLVYGAAKPPTSLEEPAEEKEEKEEKKEEKPAGDSNQPADPLLSSGSGIPDILLDSEELPCPPLDALPIGVRGKQGTGIVMGYKRVDGECITIYDTLPIDKIIDNYLPPAPVALSTAAIAATAATSAIVAKPLGDYVLKLVKPAVKKTIKKLKGMIGKKPRPESVADRRKFQRSLRK